MNCPECGEAGCTLHEIQIRVCAKCDEGKPLQTSFPRRGRGRHSWCSDCLKAYYKARRAKAPKKPKPWLNPAAWENHPHGELFLKYEDAVARAALLTVKAISERGPARRQAWAAAYDAGRKRDELRLQVMELLIPLR